MTITAEMIQQALENHHRPARTPGAKVMDALRHIQESQKRNPAGGGASLTFGGVDNSGSHCQQTKGIGQCLRKKL